ncbi:virion structural protein [Phage C48C1]|nr:virion structural protein [Phage C48C1]
MNFKRVEGHNNLVRDSRTGAVLNTNKTEIERARKIKQVSEERQQHISSLTQEVKELKKDMSQIKDLLFRLVEDNHE